MHPASVYLSGGLAALWFLPILWSNVAGLDRSFLHAHAIVSCDRVSMFAAFATIAERFREANPGSVPQALVPLGIWLFSVPSGVVKLLQVALLVANVATFAAITRRLFSSNGAAILSAAMLLCCVQLRFPRDPVAGTSLVVPWLAELELGAFALTLSYVSSRRQRTLFFALVCAFAAAITNLAGAGAVVALALLAYRRVDSRAGGAFAATAVVALVLQLFAGHPIAPWAFGWTYFATAGAQLLAAVPGVYRALAMQSLGTVPDLWHGTRFNDDRFSAIPSAGLINWLGIAGVVAAAYFGARRAKANVESRLAGGAFVASFWLVPALCVGSPALFPSGLHPGQAYDTVLLEYFGAAMAITWLLAEVTRALPGRVTFVAATVSLTVAVISYGNVRVDALVIAKNARADLNRAQLERAGSAGFFKALPEDTTLVADVARIDGPGERTADIRYAIFDYAQRRYRVVDAGASSEVHNTWLLSVDRKSEIPVSLARYAGVSKGRPLIDRAYGFTYYGPLSNGVESSDEGVTVRRQLLRDGRVLSAVRSCSPVPIADAFVPLRPTYRWSNDLLSTGPIGYDDTYDVHGGFEAQPYPKVYMPGSGAVTIYPTSCTPGILDFAVAAVSARPARLFVHSPHHTDRIDVSPKPVIFALRYRLRSRAPIVVRLTTDAPITTFTPLLFRYERDRPREERLVLEPASMSESRDR